MKFAEKLMVTNFDVKELHSTPKSEIYKGNE